MTGRLALEAEGECDNQHTTGHLVHPYYHSLLNNNKNCLNCEGSIRWGAGDGAPFDTTLR
jgi:hypothetical protein